MKRFRGGDYIHGSTILSISGEYAADAQRAGQDCMADYSSGVVIEREIATRES